MAGHDNDRQTLGKVSCTAFALNLAAFAALVASHGVHFGWIFLLIGVAVVGLLSSIAGLMAARGTGSIPELSVIGFIVNLPSVGLGLFFLAPLFGGQ